MIAEFDLSRRTALVIGAAGGLGREQALGLARAGADVAIADLNQSGLQATSLAIKAVGREVDVFPLDITVPGEVRAVVDAVEKRFG